mgnify:CR=1 FL=1
MDPKLKHFDVLPKWVCSLNEKSCLFLFCSVANTNLQMWQFYFSWINCKKWISFFACVYWKIILQYLLHLWIRSINIWVNDIWLSEMYPEIIYQIVINCHVGGANYWHILGKRDRRLCKVNPIVWWFVPLHMVF